MQPQQGEEILVFSGYTPEKLNGRNVKITPFEKEN